MEVPTTIWRGVTSLSTGRSRLHEPSRLLSGALPTAVEAAPPRLAAATTRLIVETYASATNQAYAA